MRLVVTTATRDRLDPMCGTTLEEPTVEALVRRAADATEVWLAGGEPTLRADLPELIARLSASCRVGLITDGLALTKDAALLPLCAAGLSAVRLRLHAARRDAHDWLVEMPGAAKRAIVAARRCRQRGLDLEIEARVARPTRAHAHELIELAHELGAQAVELLVAPTAVHPFSRGGNAASPRHLHGTLDGGGDQSQPRNERDGRGGVRADVDRVQLDRVQLDRVQLDRVQLDRDGCGGFSAEYVARFGTAEIDAAEVDALPRASASMAEVRFANEPTRELKQRLVQIARGGARVLRVVGPSMSHPQAAALLRETALLDFERVEVCGVAHGLDQLSDAELYALSHLDNIVGEFFSEDATTHDAHVGAPGAFEAARRGLQRFSEIAGRPAQAFILRDEERVDVSHLLDTEQHD